MRHEKLINETLADKRSNVRAPFEQSRKRPRGSPIRVLPLALAAILGTLSVVAAAAEASREISGHRYAEQIIGEALSPG